jgi:hypothetical protein
MRIKELFQESVASDLSNLGRRVAPKLMELIHRELSKHQVFESIEKDIDYLVAPQQSQRFVLSIASPLSQVFQPKELREFYEPLKDVDVTVEVDRLNTHYGSYWEGIRRVEISVAPIYEAVRRDYPIGKKQREINVYRVIENTLIHELRHALDHYRQLHGEFFEPEQTTGLRRIMPGYEREVEWSERHIEIMAELSQVLHRVNKEMEYYALEKNIVFDFESYLNDVTSIMIHRFPKLGFRSDSGDPEFYKPFIKKVYKTFDYELRRLRRMTDDEEVKNEIDIQLRKQPQ